MWPSGLRFYFARNMKNSCPAHNSTPDVLAVLQQKLKYGDMTLIAEQTGLNQSTVARIFSGDKGVRKQNIKRVIDAYIWILVQRGVAPTEIMRQSSQPEPSCQN